MSAEAALYLAMQDYAAKRCLECYPQGRCVELPQDIFIEELAKAFLAGAEFAQCHGD